MNIKLHQNDKLYVGKVKTNIQNTRFLGKETNPKWLVSNMIISICKITVVLRNFKKYVKYYMVLTGNCIAFSNTNLLSLIISAEYVKTSTASTRFFIVKCPVSIVYFQSRLWFKKKKTNNLPDYVVDALYRCDEIFIDSSICFNRLDCNDTIA